MTTVRTIRIFVCLAFAGIVAAAESRSPLFEQLVGRWESTSFVTTNAIVALGSFGRAENPEDRGLGVEDRWWSASLVATNSTRQTNLIICVYEVQPWTNSAAKGRQGLLDVGLFFTDHSGRERPIPEASGSAWLGERHIMFGGLYGYVFSYTLTNDVLTLEKLGCFPEGATLYKVRVKAALKKVSPEPGDSMRVWRPELGGAASRSQPVRPERNGTSAAAGSAR